MVDRTLRDEITDRWGQLKSERESWRQHYIEISSFVMPRSGRYVLQDRNRGQRRHNSIYDSAGTTAHRTLGAGMLAGMTSPARPWFRLATADMELMKSVPVKVWLNDISKKMLAIFSKGNTYRTLHMLYEELGAFGTAATVVLDDYQDVIRHYSLTAGEYCIATDYRGNVCTLYREFEKTVAEIVAEFGIDKVSPAVRNMYDRGQLGSWVPILHAIEPRSDRDPRMADAKNMAWRSVYLEPGGPSDSYLRESGFKYFPALAPRWAATGGDIYGNSPAMEALGDVKQLQHEQLRKAEGVDYQTKPPLQLPASLKGANVEMFPGGITYIDSAAQQGSAVRNLFQVTLNLDHLLADIKDVRARINTVFFADLFLMLANSTNTSMTATEVAERHEEKLLMLGPVLERLNDELLVPLIAMTFSRMLAAGIVPPPPPEVNGQDLNVEFVSMLAQAQRAIGTNSIDRFVGTLGQVAQIKPEVLDNFDPDQWADIYSDMLGVDPSLIVPADKVALVRQQRAQVQQQQQQAAMANAQADTAQKLAAAPTQGGGSNALQDLMNQFSGYGSPSPEQV